MSECERAKFLERMGIDTAKSCDICTRSTSGLTEDCFALEYLGTICEKASRYCTRAEKVSPGYTKAFTFEVRTTMGHYAIVSPTYADASLTVREETREPVLSVRKCSK